MDGGKYCSTKGRKIPFSDCVKMCVEEFVNMTISKHQFEADRWVKKEQKIDTGLPPKRLNKTET